MQLSPRPRLLFRAVFLLVFLNSPTTTFIHSVLIVTSSHSLYTHAHHVIVDTHLEKIGCLQRIHVLDVWQPPRPSNPELRRCISEIRFCYRGRVRFDDSIGSRFQRPVWQKRLHMNLRVPKCRRREGTRKARIQCPFFPLDGSRCNKRLPIFHIFILPTNCKSFGLCLSVPNNKIDETVVLVFQRLPGCWFL